MEERTASKLIKIAITGPESTGKSRLAKELSEYYRTTWVPECAREYLNKYGPSYTASDVENIANAQLHREKQAEATAHGLLFYDTDLLVCQIWMENAFGKSPQWLKEAVNSATYHHTFLMNIDLPWQPDPLREHPDKRDFLFRWYERELIRANRVYTVISGDGYQRTLQAIQEIGRIKTEQLL